MKYMKWLVLLCVCLVQQAHAVVLDPFIQDIKTPKQEQFVTPETTTELRSLFSKSTVTQIPRVFVDKLPEDFAEKGDPLLYSRVLAALILRENEKAFKDQIVVNALKRKYDNNETWTDMERAYFNELVDKYDVVAKKTIPTQLEQLLLKANDVPVGMAVAQSVYDTDWGKKQMESPYGQTGWLDEKTYDKIKFDSLVSATESYVKEMNSTPNYFMWRIQREKAVYKGINNKRSYNFAIALRVYRPEDPIYPAEIRKIILNNTFLSQMDNLSFLEEKKQ